MIENIDKKQFKEIINNSDTSPVFVDFYAEWCSPCKNFERILLEVEKKVSDVAKIYRVDIDKEQELAERFAVMSVPTLILFRDKAPHRTLIGVRSIDEVIDMLS